MTMTDNPIRNGVDTATLFATLDAVKGNTRDRQVPVPRHQHVGQRHPQPLDDPRLLRRHAGDDPRAAVHLRRRPPGRARRRATTARRRSSSCCHALAACLTAGIANIAAARGVNLDSVESTVEGDIDLLGILGLSDEVRNGYQQIKVSFKLRGDDPEKLRQVVEQSRRARPSTTCSPTACPSPSRSTPADRSSTDAPGRRPAGAAPPEPRRTRPPRSTLMPTTDTLVIGAGQAGLAASHCLTEAGIDHVVLERGRVAERWRSERWDSLRLLTPNWATRLPGWAYRGQTPTAS